MPAFLTPRFFVDATLAAGTTAELPPDALHHARRVLRLEPGTSVALFNGRGGEYHGRLVPDGPRGLVVALESFVAREAESPVQIHLGQGLASSDKMDWIVAKAVEVGVCTCHPLTLERSVVRLDDERAARRIARWQDIARAASEQCGRNRIMQVSSIVRLEQWLAGIPPAALRIALAPGAAAPLSSLDAALLAAPVFLAIGPEGGFAPAEQARLEHAGFAPFSLGARVLRTETAAIVAATVLDAVWTMHAAGAAP